jgi:hypothetical protein
MEIRMVNVCEQVRRIIALEGSNQAQVPDAGELGFIEFSDVLITLSVWAGEVGTLKVEHFEEELVPTKLLEVEEIPLAQLCALRDFLNYALPKGQA